MFKKVKTEDKKRDYKAEYKKFQSSDKAKKYRAELNQYNRKKGTYGNGDGKDASHKGGGGTNSGNGTSGNPPTAAVPYGGGIGVYDADGTDGVDGRGGGGGAGNGYPTDNKGGSGGDGIVIIRYETS